MLQVAYLLLALSATKVNGSPIGDTKHNAIKWDIIQQQAIDAELFRKSDVMIQKGKITLKSKHDLDLQASLSAAQNPQISSYS